MSSGNGIVPSLEACLIQSEFSDLLKALIAYHQVEFKDSIFCVHFKSALDCFDEPARELRRVLTREIRQKPNLKNVIKKIRFQCPHEGWEYSITDRANTKPLTSHPVVGKEALMMKFNAMKLPIITEEEALREINSNIHIIDKLAFQMPGSLISMEDGKPLLVSNNIHYSCGIQKRDLLRISSNNDYFPPDELKRYQDAIITGRGSAVVIRYKAPKIGSDQLFDRYVEARLVKLQYGSGSGEVARLVKLLELPRPIN